MTEVIIENDNGKSTHLSFFHYVSWGIHSKPLSLSQSTVQFAPPPVSC